MIVFEKTMRKIHYSGIVHINYLFKVYDLSECFFFDWVIVNKYFFLAQVAENEQPTYTDLVQQLTENLVTDLEKAR